MRHLFRQRTRRLVHHMTHPGGSSNGVRWLPLAKWIGWPARTWHALAALMMNESSGRQNAHNDTSPTYCRGLLQEARCWYHGKWHYNPFDPLKNLYYGLKIWVLQHGSFLPAWQGDPAVS
jgi:hypothetical protein